MTDEPPIEDRWYWDRRTETALYPRRTDEDTVEFVTVWHREEATDATETGALVPIEEVSVDRTMTTLDLIESYRTPERVEREAAATDGGEHEQSDGGED